MRSAMRAAAVLFRTFGIRGAAQRALYIAKRRAGLYRASPRPTPHRVLERVRSSSPPAGWPFVAEARSVARATNEAAAIERADRVLRGEHEAFRTRWLPRPRTPDDWSVHPRSGHRYPATEPWFRIATIDPAAGDIKDVWEPGRFGWSYDLLRGWMVTGHDGYIAGAWAGVESFLDGCEPPRGVQWACGQESAIRAFAWLWLEATANAPSSTPERLGRLREALVATADRVDDALEYALSQRNNHAISEAAALVALGARFRGIHPRAEGWLRRGRRTLEHIIRDQIAEDGWYIQHSFTYARVALDQLVLAERALRATGTGLSAGSIARIRAAVALLAEVADAETGDVPNHGANDGAFVLPLTTAGYRDFRPSLTAAATTFGAPLPADIEGDAEMLAWLGEHTLLRSAPRAGTRVAHGPSGWLHAVVPGARVFARAGRYRARPGHIDPLHVDVWIDGHPVAVDAGTYRYASEPWSTALASIEAHNTLSLPAHPVSRRGPRFLWLGWPAARVRSAAVQDGTRVRIEMEHDSWQVLGIVHRRTVILEPGGVRVDDEVSASDAADREAVVHWLLDGPADLVEWSGDPDPRATCRKGDARTTDGWLSERYGERRPVTSLRLHATTRAGRLRITTLFGSARRAHTHAPAAAEMATS